MRFLDLSAGRPCHRGSVSVFPLYDSRAVPTAGFSLGAAAVSVSELPQPRVDRVLAHNHGDLPALLLDGEAFEGGWQTRMLVGSRILEPRVQRPVRVRCLESARFSGAAEHQRSGRRATMGVRAVQDQGEVWAAVGRAEQRHQRAGLTHSLVDALADAETEGRRLLAGLRPLPGQTGVLLGVAGQVAVAESFDNADALAAAWDGLLTALAVDAVTQPALATPARRAWRFLDRVAAVPLQRAPEGRVTGRSPYAEVRTLRWRHRNIHSTLINTRHPLVSA